MPGSFSEQLHSIKIPVGCANNTKYATQSYDFLALIPLATVVFIQLLRLGSSSLSLRLFYSKQK